MPGTHPFRKYGQVFEDNEGQPVHRNDQPESPYDALPYKTPEKRPSKEQEEASLLQELRGEADNHYD